MIASAKVLSPLQIRKPDIFHCGKVFTYLHTKSACHICFTASGSPSNKNVAVFCDVFTGRQTADQRFIQFSSRFIVNDCNTGIRLLQFYLTERPLAGCFYDSYIQH